MIIDVHYHLMRMVTKEGVTGTAKHAIRAAQLMGKQVEPETVIQKALKTWGDPDGDRMIEAMDESGVDLTLVCNVDNSNIAVVTAELMQERNKALSDVAKRHEGRVMALAGVDPRRSEAPDMMKQCMEEFGMRGLKYHPDNGYDPSSPESYKVLEILEKNNGVLLTHTGPLDPPSRPGFADPRLLANLGPDFPELKIIAAHMGAVDWRPWAALAAFQPNLHGDMAMWDALAVGNFKLFCRELRDILDLAGPTKVLFGTDNPIFNTVNPTKDYIQLIKDLPAKAPDGIDFTEEEVANILGGNAAAMLGLN